MPRPATGTIESHAWRDGRTVTWRVRVPFHGRRPRITLGTNHEGWNEERAKVELERIMGQVERGTWQPPPSQAATPTPPEDEETIHVTASRWWLRKQEEGLAPKTAKDYRWRLDYILEFLAEDVTAALTVKRVDEFKAWLTRQRSERDDQPLAPRSVNMVLVALAAILDDAIEYDLLPTNPARGRRRRVREPGARRLWLEPDMVVDLLDAAGQWEAELPEHQSYGRRAVLATLCLAGPRISELTAARRDSLDIHSGIWRVGESKTEAGERDVDLTAFLLAELRARLAAERGWLNVPITSKLRVFPTRTGGELNQSNVRTRLIAEAVKRANEKRAEERRMLLPAKVTPHTLRRTFASLCLLAGRDIRWVMAQFGHKTPNLMLEIYAQTMQRQRVDHELVWELMRFPDEDQDVTNSPTNSPILRSAPSDRREKIQRR